MIKCARNHTPNSLFIFIYFLKFFNNNNTLFLLHRKGGAKPNSQLNISRTKKENKNAYI